MCVLRLANDAHNQRNIQTRPPNPTVPAMQHTRATHATHTRYTHATHTRYTRYTHALHTHTLLPHSRATRARRAHVCRIWNACSFDGLLWRDLDGYLVLLLLASHGYFSAELHLSKRSTSALTGLSQFHSSQDQYPPLLGEVSAQFHPLAKIGRAHV